MSEETIEKLLMCFCPFWSSKLETLVSIGHDKYIPKTCWKINLQKRRRTWWFYQSETLFKLLKIWEWIPFKIVPDSLWDRFWAHSTYTHTAAYHTAAHIKKNWILVDFSTPFPFGSSYIRLWPLLLLLLPLLLRVQFTLWETYFLPGQTDKLTDWLTDS